MANTFHKNLVLVTILFCFYVVTYALLAMLRLPRTIVNCDNTLTIMVIYYINRSIKYIT